MLLPGGQGMKPLSVDLRHRILASVAAGESQTSVAKRYQVSRRTVYGLVQLAKVGDVEPAPHPGNPTAKKLTPFALELLQNWLQAKSDLTLKKIQRRFRDELGIYVSQTAIWKRMRAMKLTWKKNGSCG
jgi:putative transposase